MKFNVIKAIIAFGISLVLGLICYEIAQEVGYRNYFSLAFTTITDFVCLLLAFGYDYSYGNRNVNIRVTAGLFAAFVVLLNIVFGFFLYNIVIYASITVLIMLLDILLIYALSKGASKNQ